MNKPVNFKLAKLLKEKGFDKQCLNFYTKPNSKVFGIDEHGRTYSIKNTPKKLYIIGEHAVLKNENIYYASTIVDAVMWLYEKHSICISVYAMDKWLFNSNNKEQLFDYSLKQMKLGLIDITKKPEEFNSPTEAYEAAIEYILKNLI